MKIENISHSIIDYAGSHRLQRQSEASRKLAELMGMEFFHQAAPEMKIMSTHKKKDHLLYDMSMQTEPGITMPFFVLTPPDAESLTERGSPQNRIGRPLTSYPVIIVPHGHGCDGRYGPAGISRHEQMEEQQSQYNHDLGVQFVRRGYIAVCPDARGAGDRRNQRHQGLEIDQLLSSSCTDLNNAFISLGSSLAAAWCWDLMALTDLIIGKEWGDADRIGVCGFSGGGQQSLFLSALESRISCTGVSGYFFQFDDCILDSNRCSCNFIPSFARSFDMASLALLIAPSPLIIEKGITDPLNGRRGIVGPRELIERVKTGYRQRNSERQFKYSEFPGGHSFSGRDIFSFFEDHLRP